MADRFTKLENMIDAFMVSYIPTAFNENLSLVQKVNKCIAFLNTVIDQQNVLSDFVDATTDTQNASIQSVRDDFDALKLWAEGTGLEDTLDTVLSDWDNTGKLDQIINQQVFGDFQNQLNTKATNIALNAVASGSPKGVYASVSALQTSFPTGNTNIYVVTADGGWYYWNGTAWTKGATYQSTGLSAGSVAEDRTTFFKKSTKNLLNPTTANIGYFLSSGALTAGSYNTTDYIPVSASTSYVANQQARFVEYYDSGKSYLTGSVSQNVAGFTTPANASFIRLSFPSNFDLYKTQVEQGTVSSAFDSYYKFNYPTSSDLILTNKAVQEKATTFFTISTKNLFNPNTPNNGYFLNNGALATSTAYNTSDYIPASPSTTYVLNQQCRFIEYYDLNKVYISNGQNLTSFTPPSLSVYMRITFIKEVDFKSVQLEVGATSTTFEAYATFNYSSVSGSASSKWNGKSLSSFGDSITAQNSWQPYISSKFSLTLNNYGVSGTKIADSGGDTQAMCRDERINAIDVNSNIVLIMGGTNDWAQNVPLGTFSRTNLDTTTFYGACNVMLKKMVTRLTTARILVLGTPFGTYPNRSGWTDTSGLINNLNLQTVDYGKAIIDVARLWGIPTIDIGGQAGWNEANIATYIGNDGAYLHPNDTGAKRIASLVIGKLNSLEPVS